MFVSIYFLSFYFLLYLRNRQTLFDSPEIKKQFKVSVLIPAYNEKDTIEDTINAVMKIDYDKVVEVIVIDDGSQDDTSKIVERLKKKYKNLILLKKENSGKADSLNQGIKIAKGELIAVVDSDSFPQKDSLKKMIGHFEDEKVGVVTCPVLARNKKTFFEKLQAIEYSIIALTRKLLEGIGAVYVTPGPLALYRKTALEDVGGFDKGNLTEDIEITWNLAAKGWARNMSLDTRVTTLVPTKFKQWFRQRKRWSMGGIQTMWKYKHYALIPKNIVGHFILPFFILSTFLGLLGLSIFTYLISSRLIRQYFLVKFSLVADTAIVSLNTFYFTPSVLNYLGIVLFFLGAMFSIFVLAIIKEEVLKKKNILQILSYLTFYLAIYPIIMITAIFKLLKRDLSW